MSKVSWDKSAMTKAYASKWGLDIEWLKAEHESQLFTQRVSGDLATGEEEELDTQRAQDSNPLMNKKM